MAKEIPTNIANYDLLTLAHWTRTYAEDAAQCQSATTRSIHPSDLARFISWLDRLMMIEAHFNSIPVIDSPANHKRPYDVVPWPNLEVIESPACQHFIYALEGLHTEILCSQSSEKASGVEAADHGRWRTMMEKERLYLTEIVALSADDGGEPDEHDRGIDVPDVNAQRPPVNATR